MPRQLQQKHRGTEAPPTFLNQGRRFLNRRRCRGGCANRLIHNFGGWHNHRYNCVCR